MVLYVITGSKDKFIEVKKALHPIKVEQKEIDLIEIQSLDSKEVIKHKLNEAAKYSKGEFIVDDVSLSLFALNKMPGPLIKWFLKGLGVKKIYELCKLYKDYDAEAKSTIGYTNGKELVYFEGIVKGKIVEPREGSDFGWDPIFVPEGNNKAFCEMTKEEKNLVSHRGRALKKFKEYYLNRK